MMTTVLLVAVAVIIIGVAVFSWRFENVGDDTAERNLTEDADKVEK